MFAQKAARAEQRREHGGSGVSSLYTSQSSAGAEAMQTEEQRANLSCQVLLGAGLIPQAVSCLNGLTAKYFLSYCHCLGLCLFL